MVSPITKYKSTKQIVNAACDWTPTWCERGGTLLVSIILLSSLIILLSSAPSLCHQEHSQRPQTVNAPYVKVGGLNLRAFN